MSKICFDGIETYATFNSNEIVVPKLAALRLAVDTIKSCLNMHQLAILAPIQDDVESINDYMFSLLPGEESTYLSSNSISNQDPNSELADV
ncbi:ATP-dependent DNA helicase PIF1-like [Senna tora]|uniref:ATP-dependent DNA helicase PIF1-like n=1 Tax=Senna tora TaxID=362788 RepID=A0A834SR17_9FABA|nr:ATP-dependent DNA helicase PIF1-like [Senna tora]